MTYIFKCTKCNKKDERDIPISDYDKEKHRISLKKTMAVKR